MGKFLELGLGEITRKAKEAKALTQFPSIEEIYKLYGYVPSSPETSEKLDIYSTPEIETRIIEEATKVLARPFYKDYYEGEIVIPPNLRFCILKRPTERRIEIQLRQLGTVVAEFYLKYGSPSWEVTHRLVNERYRGQGIGSQVLKTLEAIVQRQADISGKKQSLLISAHQVDILNFAIKSGYFTQTPEDMSKLTALLKGEKSKILVLTAWGRPGYMASIDRVKSFIQKKGLKIKPEEIDEKKVGELVYHDSETLDNFLAMAYTINFQKDFLPPPAN